MQIVINFFHFIFLLQFCNTFLDAFNSRGLPTSTTVSLVFELLGGTVALAMIKNIQTDGALTFAQMINTDKALSVILGIFLSIAIALSSSR